MADENGNLVDETARTEAPAVEDEDTDVDLAPDDALDAPSDLPDAGIEDDSGFLEEVIDDGHPLLEMDEGTRVGVGGLE